jgi:hypothetical protein
MKNMHADQIYSDDLSCHGAQRPQFLPGQINLPDVGLLLSFSELVYANCDCWNSRSPESKKSRVLYRKEKEMCAVADQKKSASCAKSKTELFNWQKNARCPRIFPWTSFASCCMKVEIWMGALLQNTEGNIPYLFDIGAKTFLVGEDGGRRSETKWKKCVSRDVAKVKTLPEDLSKNAGGDDWGRCKLCWWVRNACMVEQEGMQVAGRWVASVVVADGKRRWRKVYLHFNLRERIMFYPIYWYTEKNDIGWKELCDPVYLVKAKSSDVYCCCKVLWPVFATRWNLEKKRVAVIGRAGKYSRMHQLESNGDIENLVLSVYKVP